MIDFEDLSPFSKIALHIAMETLHIHIATLEDQNRTLEALMQRTNDFSITLNREKCRFGVSELEFYGYRFTGEGLKPTEETVEAVTARKPPKSKDEVFLA